MSAIWTVARRELKMLFDLPTGYILLVVFIAFNDYMFFVFGAYRFNVASLRPMFDLLPWLFLFFIPLVTMRSLAEDVRTGTIEIVLAQPITELQLLLGKFLGQLLFVWIALGLTFPTVIGLSLGADLHAGVIVAQYFGAALLAAGLTAVGVWTSSLTRNQITAAIIAIAAIFVLLLISWTPVLDGLPPSLSTVALHLGVLSHFRDIARGVIDLRDVIYFTTLAAAFLSLAYTSLMGRRLSPAGEGLKRLRMATVLMVVGLVVINLFGRNIRGRLDLTPGRAYTLSRATRDLVGNLSDIVTLKWFVSRELPPELAMLRRDIDDVLRDYRGAGRGRLRVIVQDPAESPEIEEEARNLGVPPVQFNVIGESEFTVRDGYLGLAIQFADQTETIPFIQRTDDLEYRLSSAIRGMTLEDKATVGFYIAPVAQQQPTPRSFNTFRQELQKTYEVRTMSLPEVGQPSDSVDVMVLIGAPDALALDQMDRLRAFLDRGGSALFMADGMQLPGQSEFVMAQDVLWNELLEPYGIKIRSDMAYDLLSNEQVALPTQFGQMVAPYPLWIRALSTRRSSVNQDIEGVFMPWTSTLDTSGAVAGTVVPLFVTSQGAGIDSMMAMLAPQRRFRRDGLGVRLLGAAVNPLAVDDFDGPRGRVIVVGNSDFLQDRFVQGTASNLAFGLNAVDWLAQDEALIGIRAKNRTPPALVFSSETKRDLVKYANIIGIPLLIIALAILRLLKRRQMIRRRYVRVAASEVVA